MLNPEQIWFTSDHHFGHDKILELCKRPFSSPTDMYQSMVDKWNSVVKPGDLVFHIGDLTFKGRGDVTQWLKQLNGQIYLLRGNHECEDKVLQPYCVWVKDYATIRVADPDAHGGSQKIVLHHYPYRSWVGKNHDVWNIHGHEHHHSERTELNQLNVCVDLCNFKLYSYADVKNTLLSY